MCGLIATFIKRGGGFYEVLNTNDESEDDEDSEDEEDSEEDDDQ